jgi:excisionase family DNA binding protein
MGRIVKIRYRRILSIALKGLSLSGNEVAEGKKLRRSTSFRKSKTGYELGKTGTGGGGEMPKNYFEKSESSRIPKAQLLSMKQAAAYLNVSIRTLMRRINSREMAFVRVFGQYRFKIEDLEKFIADNRTPSITEQKKKVISGIASRVL